MTRPGTRWSGAAVLTGVVLLHLVMAAGFHLSPDEAHYALYASHLDWSYFDHPPLVGWIQWPALMLGGGDWLMRLVPMVCWWLAAVGIARVAADLYPPGQAWIWPPC
jgi:4-amino-4-deoxy-L-arabinose transferase-like glycosyltransferase